MKRVFETSGRRLWHNIEQPKLFGLNTWEKRNWGDDEEVPQQAAVKTADDLFNEAIAFARENTPLAYGARESALADYASGNKYYESYQPTSFEQALGNQYFQNVMPDVERSIKQNLSLSGIESSPVLASLIGTQRGNLGVSIGEYLSNLGNTRATNSLNARMGIDPYSTYGNYLNTDTNQSNLNNKITYQNALENYNATQANQEALSSMISSLFGTGVNALTGGTSSLSNLFGNSGSSALGTTVTSSSDPYLKNLFSNALSTYGKAASVY
jgi:hypothetical protein